MLQADYAAENPNSKGFAEQRTAGFLTQKDEGSWAGLSPPWALQSSQNARYSAWMLHIQTTGLDAL